MCYAFGTPGRCPTSPGRGLPDEDEAPRTRFLSRQTDNHKSFRKSNLKHGLRPAPKILPLRALNTQISDAS
jgi:hypothetical protein